MPAPSDFGDGATVIEGPGHAALHAHAHAHVAHGGSSSHGKRVESSLPSKNSDYYRDGTSFAKTTDYFSEERPFVVLIKKDGVIGALRKLDEHLRNVCMSFFYPTPSHSLRVSSADD